MTTQPDTTSTSGSAAAPVTVTARPREYLYFVSYRSMETFGNSYLMLTFPIETRDDVDWVRDELRRQGMTNAIVLSFALLPGGWRRS